jgi:hypothetical protein
VTRACLTVSAAMLVLVATLFFAGCQNGTPTTISATTTSTAAPQPESMAPVPAAFQRCTDCHEDFDAFLATSKVLTTRFGHLGHLSQGRSCESCHAAPPHPAEGATVLPTMLACFSCHGQTATPSASSACLSCHPLGFPLTPSSHGATGWLQPGVGGGSGHAKASEEEKTGYCKMCHAERFCADCHGRNGVTTGAGSTTGSTSAP